ncbi:cilium assembly protein DZIP1 isoform X2 [Spea bombifrons]|uniref:cilium assembly protein DZIP1 isoform X2 n=1 Tax=Spea bombifrons TaxID=233779 RepID=UPI002349DD4E|nr:cilium assembly protein DZIP1 isoform X2 [Spea bombifrons]
MPVHDGVYYLFELETPQLSSVCVTDPRSSHHSNTAFQMPSSNNGTVFKFRSRHESVDWRRIGGIDVDKVANELDFNTLQDNIMNITYCNVENERCPHCKNGLDPILVKLFRLAQLLIEYLLHSQEYLTSCLQTLEQKVQATLKEKEEIKLKMVKQSEEVKKLKEECKHRKAMIATQQMMITSGANSYNKCHHCDKAFVNYSYLQGHIQRRHPEEARCEKPKSDTSGKLQQEINLLKEELKLTKGQLETEKAAHIERLSKMQENKQRKEFEEEILKKFENWKAEENKKSANEMEKVKEMFMKEFKELSVKNSSLEEELRQMKKDTLYSKSGVGVLHESPSGGREQKSNYSHDIGAVMELLHTQEQKLENKIHLLCQEHDKEKKQLTSQIEKLKRSLSEDQRLQNDLNQKQMHEFEQKILEQNELIRSQKEQIKKMAIKTSASVPKHTVNVVSRPSVVSQEDEAEAKSNSLVARAIEKKTSTNQNFLNAIKKNKMLSKELRSIVEEGLNEKLEALGVKPGTRGMSREDLNRTLSVMQSSREEKEKLLPEIAYYRSSLLRLASSKAEERASSTSYCKPPHASQLLAEPETPAFESPSSTLMLKKSKSKTSVVKRSQDEFQTQPQSPVPIKSSTPKNKIVSVKDCRVAKRSSITTPPFSSDEEEEDMNGTPVQLFRSADLSKPKTSFDKKGSGDFAVNSDSEGSLLEEAEPQKAHKQNIQIKAPIKPARVATLVRERTEQIEKQVASYSSENKPAGSVDVTRPFLKKDPVMEFKVDDIEDSDFDSLSLEEDAFEVPRSMKKQQNVTVPRNGFSPAPVKSAFGPAKSTKPEAREVDASSTLVSSLVSVSDFSDCSDLN